jgi:hypothetical protein
VLNRCFGYEGQTGEGNWKLRLEKIIINNNCVIRMFVILYYSPDRIIMIKGRRMGWAERVVCMEEIINAQKFRPDGT